ncbi:MULTISPECIES: hypothetical protein [Streptomyces]|uniref:hypothetical protein n=1 Tax=Streptomyces TaxID=1883 RepID=UPI0011B065B6|nr:MULTISPECIES: hypothetical protein [unclassified Streptomyces]QXQ97153.1 hypothetical protein KV381_12825 [Streptomyces sp. WY228]
MGVNRIRNNLIVGLLLAVCVTACSSDPEPQSPYVNAAEVCEGVFAGGLEKTVETVTGATSFERRAGGGMNRLIEKIEKGYASGRSWSPREDLCEMATKWSRNGEETVLAFHIYAPQDVNYPGNPEGAKRFSLGKEAVANVRSAGIYFECVSPQLDGSKNHPARIYGGLSEARDRGDALENLMDNLEIVHSASLAVAEKLECEDDAGLPKKLDRGLRQLPPVSRPAEIDS